MFFILFGYTYHPDKIASNKDSNATPKQEIKITLTAKPTDKPTPTSTDPCHEYAGTDRWRDCNELNFALERKKDPKLNATVNFGSSSLSITNNDDVEWTACIVYIPNVMAADPYANDTGIVIGAHQTGYIPWSDLTLLNGQRFNYYTTKPQSVEIECWVGPDQKSNHSIFYSE